MTYLSWGIALLSMIVSLIFSEVLKLPPCPLCWYQRVFMYSLVFVLPTGILLRDAKVSYYAAVLSFAGGLTALYHNLIYYDFINEGFKLCTADLSCKSKQLEVLGFLTIPTMSLVAFAVIFGLSLKGLKNEGR